MPDVIFEEIECKSAIHKVSQGAARMLPFRWTLNPYRGCQHACTYCFARGSHEHLGYDAGRDFETADHRQDECAGDAAAGSWPGELAARIDRRSEPPATRTRPPS